MSDTTRTPLAFIAHLLDAGAWYGSAIELDAYAPHHANGAALEAEARRIIEAGSGRCWTCRWWRAPSAIDGDLGQCLRVVDSSGLTHGSKAVPLGGRDDFFGRLLTKPDFGCVQWEGKPDAG